MMVLLTAYLYDGVPPAGEDSEMRDRSIEFCKEIEVRIWAGGPLSGVNLTMIVVFHPSVFECS